MVGSSLRQVHQVLALLLGAQPLAAGGGEAEQAVQEENALEGGREKEWEKDWVRNISGIRLAIRPPSFDIHCTV